VDRNYHSPDRNLTIENIVKETGETANSLSEHIASITERLQEATGEHVIAIYPICKYEHGGVSYSLGVKHGFDYSNNGFYIVTDETNRAYGLKGKNRNNRFEKIIKAELETFNKYANGECYAFTLYDKDGEVIDSCGGFYDIEDIREHLPKEWSKEDLNQYYK
jgi:hypothetical protein